MYPGKTEMRRGAACHLMRRDESAPDRTAASPLPVVQSGPPGERTWRLYAPNTFAKRCLIGHVSPRSKLTVSLKQNHYPSDTPGESDTNAFLGLGNEEPLAVSGLSSAR